MGILIKSYIAFLLVYGLFVTGHSFSKYILKHNLKKGNKYLQIVISIVFGIFPPLIWTALWRIPLIRGLITFTLSLLDIIWLILLFLVFIDYCYYIIKRR